MKIVLPQDHGADSTEAGPIPLMRCNGLCDLFCHFHRGKALAAINSWNTPGANGREEVNQFGSQLILWRNRNVGLLNVLSED